MKFATRLFLLIFLVNGITALVSTSIFLRTAHRSEQEDLQRSMTLVVTVATARYEGYIDRATAVLDTVVADKDVRNFFIDHTILRHYSQQAARRRLTQLIESNPSIGDMVVASSSERASMVDCSVNTRTDLGSFVVSCDGERAFKILSRPAGTQVRADVLVDLQRFVDTQVAPLLRDQTRLLLLHTDGTVLAATGGSLSEGRSWLLDSGIGVPATAGIVDQSGGHHTMRKSHGDIDFLLISPVSAFRGELIAAWQWAGLTALFLIVVPGVIALVLSRSMSSRLRALAAASRTLDGRDAIEIDATGTDEVAELAAALRDLNARVLRSTEELEAMVSERTAVIEEQKAELVRLNERLREMASRDSLTQLLNRRAFEAQAANVLALARREGRGLGVAMVDVDFFKTVNDEYGHQAGDAALRVIASLLGEHFRRDSDLIGRYGGEEFAVVTTAARIDAEFAQVLEEFRATVAAQSIEAEGRSIALTVSCGAVVTVPGPEDELEELLNHADRALYAAKAQGRDRVVINRRSVGTSVPDR